MIHWKPIFQTDILQCRLKNAKHHKVLVIALLLHEIYTDKIHNRRSHNTIVSEETQIEKFKNNTPSNLFIANIEKTIRQINSMIQYNYEQWFVMRWINGRVNKKTITLKKKRNEMKNVQYNDDWMCAVVHVIFKKFIWSEKKSELKPLQK